MIDDTNASQVEKKKHLSTQNRSAVLLRIQCLN